MVILHYIHFLVPVLFFISRLYLLANRAVRYTAAPLGRLGGKCGRGTRAKTKKKTKNGGSATLAIVMPADISTVLRFI